MVKAPLMDPRKPRAPFGDFENTHNIVFTVEGKSIPYSLYRKRGLEEKQHVWREITRRHEKGRDPSVVVSEGWTTFRGGSDGRVSLCFAADFLLDMKFRITSLHTPSHGDNGKVEFVDVPLEDVVLEMYNDTSECVRLGAHQLDLPMMPSHIRGWPMRFAAKKELPPNSCLEMDAELAHAGFDSLSMTRPFQIRHVGKVPPPHPCTEGVPEFEYDEFAHEKHGMFFVSNRIWRIHNRLVVFTKTHDAMQVCMEKTVGES